MTDATPSTTFVVQRDEFGTMRAITAVPDRIHIARELLESCGLRTTSERCLVDFRLENGHWVFEIVEWGDGGLTAICDIRYREEW